MRKLLPHMQEAASKAEDQRKLCREWLLAIMKATPKRTRSKADLRAEAMVRFNTSKNSFDGAWIEAIEATGLLQWYEPMRRSRARGRQP